MKKVNIFGLAIFGVLSMACDRHEDFRVSTPDFNVELVDSDYLAGDSVWFSFSGNADLLMFYSGERGDLQLSFQNQCRYGILQKCLSIMASTDFSGDYTEEGIAAAQWEDITEGFTFAPGPALVFSGAKSISHLTEPDKPLYLAVRYKADGVQEGQEMLTNWWFRDFRVDFLIPGVKTNVLSQVGSDWGLVNFAENDPGAYWFWNEDGVRLQFNGQGISTPGEGWAITEPINTDELKITGSPIKAYIDPPMNGFSYVFADPGVYDVKFEAFNVSGRESLKISHTITVYIGPAE